jgi:hypothetical protein
MNHTRMEKVCILADVLSHNALISSPIIDNSQNLFMYGVKLYKENASYNFV